MGYPEFNPIQFLPEDESRLRLIEDFKRIRTTIGFPHRMAYLRSLVRTRKHVRSVYPPGWSFR